MMMMMMMINTVNMWICWSQATCVTSSCQSHTQARARALLMCSSGSRAALRQEVFWLNPDQLWAHSGLLRKNRIPVQTGSGSSSRLLPVFLGRRVSAARASRWRCLGSSRAATRSSWGATDPPPSASLSRRSSGSGSTSLRADRRPSQTERASAESACVWGASGACVRASALRDPCALLCGGNARLANGGHAKSRELRGSLAKCKYVEKRTALLKRQRSL